MKPYTREDAEEDLAAARARGDVGAAMAAAEVLDRMPAPQPATVLGAALWYASHGLPVFPIQPGSKIPYPRTRGLKDASTDPDHLCAQFTALPDANLGLATGHRVDVIDFDGPEAHANWTRVYGEDWAAAGVTVLGTVSTPRPGGLHVYVPATGAGNLAGFVPRVDYRGLGGYVLVPPSFTPLGRYEFLRRLAPVTWP